MATGSLKGDFAAPGLFLGLNVGPTTSAATLMGGKCFHAGTGSPIALETVHQHKTRQGMDRVKVDYTMLRLYIGKIHYNDQRVDTTHTHTAAPAG